jgi:long-chain fatty acid transport protein
MKNTSIKSALFASVAVAAVTVGSVAAQAGAFGIREQSAVGQGASFAGEGTTGMGLSAMFWNPAAVTQATGMAGEQHGTLITSHAVETATTGTSPGLIPLPGYADAGNVGRTGGISAGYNAMRLSPQWFVGLSITTPYGLATGTNPNWAGQQLGTRAQISSLDVNPILGYKVNDWLSIGGGPRLLWLQGKLDSTILPPGATALLGTTGPTFLKADDYGFGFSAGATITPGPNTEIALGYRSQVSLDLGGHLLFPQLPPIALGLIAAQSPAKAAFLGAVGGSQVNIGNGKTTLPDEASFGIRQRVNDTFSLLGTVEWTHWSTVQNIAFTYTSGPALGTPATNITFNYKDGWFFSVGGEYIWDPKTTLRAGIGYEISPVTDAVRDTTLPDNNRWWFSAGISNKITDKFTIDFGYTFIYVGNTSITVNANHPDFLTIAPQNLVVTTSPYINIFAASIRYKFDAPLSVPLITKS